ncbi:MAG: hypothetical protein DMD98_03315 [Candidatus Rokuibacteriota bacterium]|nr:MAG: hypothetical protein AUH14_07265 [Candidatus Rokubacteria bacterium 13_2_20CM_69_15_1]PYN38721.1 MAG: hypothetical protein DMD98_03315 [Candidatus Rokubacteria bacterium]
MSARDDRPNAGAPPPEWKVPKLRIDVNGDWFDDDVEVTHPGVLANLRANLRRDAQGYFIQTRVRIPVDVADAPLVVVRFERSDGGFVAFLNDGTQERIEPPALRIGPRDIPYCAVRNGTFEARFSRAAAYQLLGMAEYDERTGRGVLRHGTREHELQRGV